MTIRSSRTAFWTGVATGAVAFYLFGPGSDPRRRAAAFDRVFASARHVARRAARGSRHAWSELEGAEQRLTHPHPGRPADDQALVDRILSEIHRDPLLPKGSFNVEVVKGVTVLRGELPDEAAIERVRAAVAKVDGVLGVRSLMHVPGTPAPNKKAALAAVS